MNTSRDSCYRWQRPGDLALNGFDKRHSVFTWGTTWAWAWNIGWAYSLALAVPPQGGPKAERFFPKKSLGHPWRFYQWYKATPWAFLQEVFRAEFISGLSPPAAQEYHAQLVQYAANEPRLQAARLQAAKWYRLALQQLAKRGEEEGSLPDMAESGEPQDAVTVTAVGGAAPQPGQHDKRKAPETGSTESAVEGAAPQLGQHSKRKPRETGRTESAVEGAAPQPGPQSKRKPPEAG
ncbi:hypothetical protein KFL_016110010, partial [Klebsormidium nitens]